MPKNKSKKKGAGRGDKEKPLLTVQGILRLDKTFVTAQYADAEVIKVKLKEEEEAKEVKLIPGSSEHDNVKYKHGYDLGPANPFPTNEPEAEIFVAQRAIEAKQDAFDEMKKQSEAEKKEREAKFRRENLIPENELKPPGDDEDVSMDEQSEKQPKIDPKELDPDNPDNYVKPDDLYQPLDEPMEIQDYSEMYNAGHKSPEIREPDGESTSAQISNVNSPEIQSHEVHSPEEVYSGQPEIDESLIPNYMKPLPDEQQYGKDMALSVALEMEEKRRTEKKTAEITDESRPEYEEWFHFLDEEKIYMCDKCDTTYGSQEEGHEHLRSVHKVKLENDANDQEEQEEDDDLIFSLDEMARMKSREEEEAANAKVQGPTPDREEMLKEKAIQDNKNLLELHWAFVKERPHDFQGWEHLLAHVIKIDILDEIRTAFNAFLQLYPYCFGYWIRYSDIEQNHENWKQAFDILRLGLDSKAIRLSIDLWIAYLELYHKMYKKHEDFDSIFRAQCEEAVMAVGLDFKSDVLWERYIEWERDRISEKSENLKYITEIFRRLVTIPTKLYNKHWDNFIAHVRDHHPRDILEYKDYDELRRITCKELGLTYRPDPIIEPNSVREVFLPEDKLKAGMKERIVASLVTEHETCEYQVSQRLKFEDKIKRPYFHVRPLDLKQLKNWDTYLDYEIAQGNHERIVVLFERCLIPCAKYEQFWIKYARYLENYKCHSKDETSSKQNSGNKNTSTFEFTNSGTMRKARWSFGTGLTNVDDIRERRCMWTLRGWLETDKDGNEIMVAEEIPKEKPKTVEKNKENQKENDEQPSEEDGTESLKNDEQNENVNEIPKDYSDLIAQEAVRRVYDRACYRHCPTKALIKMKYAAFEESIGNGDAARQILNKLLEQYPLLIEANMQLIDLERRLGSHDVVLGLYKKLMKKIPDNRKSIRTWIAMKLSRFQLKVMNAEEKALKTLQAALKKDKNDHRLYTQIIDICYQRTPQNINGVTSAIEFALKSDLSPRHKLNFVKRKVELMQEFGTVQEYRQAWDQLKHYKNVNAKELKAEAKKRQELEREELKLKDLEELIAQTRAKSNLKAKTAESEGKLLCNQCQASMFPDAEGFYEFERFHPVQTSEAVPSKSKKNDRREPDEEEDDGIVDLLDMEIPEDQEESIKKTLEEKTKYKEVAPTWELNIETYGYGKRRKVYDPDYEHVESAKFKEYERLEGDGYDETLKDPDSGKMRHIHAPGLGHDPRTPRTMKTYNEAENTTKYTTSDYVVPPKVPQLQMGPGIGPKRPGRDDDGKNDGDESARDVFELPPELANPQKAPCVNVPEWFVKEGGELCLSDTENGPSIIRYWPKFLSEKGNVLMFKKLRKYCKWHQKQIKIGGEWKYETRLVAWYGPCDYVYSGLELKKNLNWAPELLDLLHRLIGMTRSDFNSCFANLYRHGHDMCGWHSDVHPQLGRNPSVASVSLGAVRVFEFRKKNGPPNFIRFPLFPGSLLVMTGATQEDWLHCLPRDINCKDERINLTFRTMFAIDKRM